MKSKELLEVVVRAADEKRAEDIVALDMHEVSLLADYFIVASGSSERQVQAIVDNIDDKVEEAGGTVKSIEGKKGSKWILMDLGDVVVHVFTPEERSNYNLEQFWQDAPLVDVGAYIAEA
ncbi:ribosome silencing factor [Lacticaseibacillus pabuli]|uniref:Ribosomal silencing factor RsfS n=1 Tax=Lacticaseibacillus pabuli TaxID=3025672 RepID=A0ABY7WTR2_9LACO|nr:ribosome silencing factor [Lacticaseibacillus sp. KACC 23028]WDF83553.1 ribosome silencing factor [Lacticaseibacillus sp. KACC 23028]